MRKFLVVLDDSPECQNAMRFAAMRAARTNGGVVVLAIIPPDAIQHGIGVADLMRQEAEDRITSQYQIFARWMRDSQGSTPNWSSSKAIRRLNCSIISARIPKSGCSSSVPARTRTAPVR